MLGPGANCALRQAEVAAEVLCQRCAGRSGFVTRRLRRAGGMKLESPAVILNTVRASWWDVLKAGWRLWPIAHLVTYTLIPRVHRCAPLFRAALCGWPVQRDAGGYKSCSVLCSCLCCGKLCFLSTLSTQVAQHRHCKIVTVLCNSVFSK